MLKKEERHVVILGGGFAGLMAARELDRPGVRVTIVDRSNHHLFHPRRARRLSRPRAATSSR